MYLPWLVDSINVQKCFASILVNFWPNNWGHFSSADLWGDRATESKIEEAYNLLVVLHYPLFFNLPCQSIKCSTKKWFWGSYETGVNGIFFEQAKFVSLFAIYLTFLLNKIIYSGEPNANMREETEE